MATQQLIAPGGGTTQSVALLPSLLSSAYDAVTGTFRRYLDHELGLGEVALAAESRQAETRLLSSEAPTGSEAPTNLGSNAGLLIAGALALVAFALLSR